MLHAYRQISLRQYYKPDDILCRSKNWYCNLTLLPSLPGMASEVPSQDSDGDMLVPTVEHSLVPITFCY